MSGSEGASGQFSSPLEVCRRGLADLRQEDELSLGPMKGGEEEKQSSAEFVENLDRVDVNLARVIMPHRPGFTLPPRPATPSESSDVVLFSYPIMIFGLHIATTPFYTPFGTTSLPPSTQPHVSPYIFINIYHSEYSGGRRR